jgi:hypothetical protein
MDIRVDEYGEGDPEVVGELVTEDDDDRGYELPDGYEESGEAEETS